MVDDNRVHDSPVAWVAAHAKTYAKTGGAIGHTVRGLPMLLLTTRGRHSGALRRTPLVYGRDNADYILIASNGGAANNPSWYYNVVSDHHVTVQVRHNTFAANASDIVDPGDYQAMWNVILSLMPWCADYRHTVTRHIPLVRVTASDGTT